jgi:HEAT repeat protein
LPKLDPKIRAIVSLVRGRISRRRSWALLLALPLLFGAVEFFQTRPQTTEVHAELQRRIVEAELGSPTFVYLATLPKSPVPTAENTGSLLARLKSAIPAQRWAAAAEITKRRDPRALEALILAMKDPAGTRRVCVMAAALGHLKDPRALGALSEAAFDPANEDLRLCAIESLGMIGDARAVPVLIEALRLGNMPVAAADALARLGDERAVDALIHAASEPKLRLWMIRDLGELGSAKAVPFLVAAQDDANRYVREAAREGLWKISRLASANQMRALAQTLETDPELLHRAWAAFKLGEQGDPRATSGLLAGLADREAMVRTRAAAALVRIGRPAAQQVRKLAHSATGHLQTLAVAILGYIGSPGDIPALKLLAQETSEAAGPAAESVRLIEAFARMQAVAGALARL